MFFIKPLKIKTQVVMGKYFTHISIDFLTHFLPPLKPIHSSYFQYSQRVIRHAPLATTLRRKSNWIACPKHTYTHTQSEESWRLCADRYPRYTRENYVPHTTSSHRIHNCLVFGRVQKATHQQKSPSVSTATNWASAAGATLLQQLVAFMRIQLCHLNLHTIKAYGFFSFHFV